MDKQYRNRTKVDCVSVSYLHPDDVSSLWRTTAKNGRCLDVVMSSDIPLEVVPLIVSRAIPERGPEYEEILMKLEVKSQNISDFVASTICELFDGLSSDIEVMQIFVSYEREELHFFWAFKNKKTGKVLNISVRETPGVEITMEQFLKQNPHFDVKKSKLTKRDVRKVFVIVKKIILSFPRVANKNTPLRGLYTSPDSN